MKITIIGTGNVGYHLAIVLKRTNHQVLQIFGRNPKRFDVFPPDLASKKTSNWGEIKTTADLYIIAVNDQAIEEVSRKLKEIGVKGIVVHTSGATSIKTLQQHLEYGIFYPLQSFSQSKSVEWNSVPFCIDGNTSSVKNCLQELALSLSPIVHLMNDEQRQALHVAAVFVNNFTNRMLTLGEEICQDFDLPFDVLQPLIRETFEKTQVVSPKIAQTGPASRGDKMTLQKHLTLLQNYPDKQLLYKLISESIAK
ncbi:MAG: Rossmann-like and DUF2520 domain-containing protein [Chitinophagales bacterium]